MKKNFLSICLVLFTLLCCNIVNAQTYPVPVYTVTSSVSSQGGQEPGKCIDGDDNSLFHSQWNLSTAIPDTVDFYFTDNRTINSFEYTPRPSGPNGIWTKVELWYSTKAAPNSFTKLTELTWAGDNTKKTYTIPATGIVNAKVIRFVVTQANSNFSSCAEMRFYSNQAPTSANNNISLNGIQTLADSQISVIGATDNNHNGSETVAKTIDNNTSTLYHSRYSGGGFPIELKYDLANTDKVDYLVYTPRQDGNPNGLFGNIEIWYKTLGGSLIKLMDYDCRNSRSIQKIDFPQAIQNPDSIMVKVLNGKNNFASCAEMQFFKKGNFDNHPYTNIFSDNIYSALKSGITQSSIDTISNPFFKSLAQSMLDGQYNAKFRVQDYELYPNVGTTASILKTSTYNQFENPTGIFFKAGDTALIFVDNYSVPSISIRVRDFAKDDTATDDTYLLNPGINMIKINHDGLSYINYYFDNANYAPIKINIVTGKVNGFFDATTDTNEDWQNLLGNAVYPKLDIKGQYINLNYNVAPLKSECPFNGLGLVAAYDSIVRFEFELMGLFKYNRVPKNHMFAFSAASNGYHAGGMGAHFALDWGWGAINKIDGLDMWGIPHELGHVNQTRPGMRWIGTTEVTNNLFSVWCQYTMNRGQQGITRLEQDWNRFDRYLDSTVIFKHHIQTMDVFQVLTPMWQLELYYQVAGASKGAPTLLDEMKGIATAPTSGVDYAHWLADVFEKVRNTNENGLTNGQLLLNFVKNTCDAVQEDLTDYFKRTGFLRPFNGSIDDYGLGDLVITQYDIDTLVASIKAKNYAKPVSPVINYISALSVNAFKNKLPVSGTTGQGVTVQSGSIVIDNTNEWKNVTVFETYSSDTLNRITLIGTGDNSSQTTTVPYTDNNMKVYAVGYDGAKILVYPASATPVKFVQTTATVSNNTSIDIKWQVGVEQNVKKYVVQKSIDSNNFTDIGNVQAEGLTSYKMTDNNTLTGKLFYRIKAINNDGSIEYSNIFSVFVQQVENPTIKLSVYPNPATSAITVTFSGDANIVQLQLYNLKGSIVLSKHIDKNNNTINLDIQSLAKGIYFIKLIKSDGTNRVKKIIKL